MRMSWADSSCTLFPFDAAAEVGQRPFFVVQWKWIWGRVVTSAIIIYQHIMQHLPDGVLYFSASDLVTGGNMGWDTLNEYLTAMGVGSGECVWRLCEIPSISNTDTDVHVIPALPGPVLLTFPQEKDLRALFELHAYRKLWGACLQTAQRQLEYVTEQHEKRQHIQWRAAFTACTIHNFPAAVPSAQHTRSAIVLLSAMTLKWKRNDGVSPTKMDGHLISSHQRTVLHRGKGHV